MVSGDGVTKPTAHGAFTKALYDKRKKARGKIVANFSSSYII
jgi:hypothetical protein